MSILVVNSTNANGNNFLHRHAAATFTQHQALLLPTAVSTAVAATEHSPTAVFRTVVKLATATGSGFGVLTQSYSYDGVLHLESFISDI